MGNSNNILKNADDFYKLAAILQAPPRMVKEISDWAISYYCIRALQELDKTKVHVKLRDKIWKVVEDLFDGPKIKLLTQSISSDYKAILPAENNEIYEINIAHFDKDQYDIRTGIMGVYDWKNSPPALRLFIIKKENDIYDFYSSLDRQELRDVSAKTIISYIKYNKKHILKILQNFKIFVHSFRIYNDDLLRVIDEAIVECMLHIKGNINNPQIFPINFDELSYFSMPQTIPKGVKPYIQAGFISSIGEQEMINKRYGVGEKDSSEWTGLWTGKVFVNFKVPKLEKGQLNAKYISGITIDIKDTVRHELQHLVQTYIRDIKGLKDMGGLPSKKLIERDVDFYGRPTSTTNQGSEVAPHQIRDIEFYTRLQDTVDRFKKISKSFPLAMRNDLFNLWIDRIDMNTFRKKLMDEVLKRDRKWIDLGSEFYKEFWEINSEIAFFRAIKNKNPAKYNKAVKEFYKAVMN